MSARKRLYDYIKKGGKKRYSTEELRRVGEVSDWARVLRQLRQDGIIDYKNIPGYYSISSISEYSVSTKRSGLNSRDKYRIRHRDGYRCQTCGKSANDGIKLHIDHKVPVEWGGTNNDDNLWTLCEECNLAKKSFFKDDFDAEVMKLVYAEKSGYQKLKVLFENSPNTKFPPSILQGIAGIRDWTRTIRNIRKKHKINITWFEPDKDNPNGYYSNIQ